MNFTTRVDISGPLPPIGHDDHLLLIGSCFAQSMGQMLAESKFHCDLNPFGILYNPLSIAVALRRIMDGKQYTTADLFHHQGLYHNFMYHGSFSRTSNVEAIDCMNARLDEAHSAIPQVNRLLITFGTAWIYTRRGGGGVVANCHKVPAREFERRRLSVGEIVDDYKQLIGELLKLNPSLRIIFTVSPIRHLKDGLHENQLSKSTLLLAVAELVEAFPGQVFYFPSYEIMIDELRDYRFYADDMLHPSAVAVKYIWQRFGESFFSPSTKKIINDYESIHRDINHKPFNPGSVAHKRFLEQLVLKIERLKEKYPNFDVQNELDICLTRLNELPNL